MADLDLDAIKARLEATTPGTWQRYLYNHGGSRIYTEKPKRELIADTGGLDDTDDRIVNTFQRGDADFFFCARDDVAALLAEVERLRQRADVAEEMVAALVDREQTLLRPVIDAAPSVERLRELVKWCDLLDTFASKVDPAYTLPRDEIQRDLTRLADALEAVRGGDGRGQ